jgi:hypothetical protein
MQNNKRFPDGAVFMTWGNKTSSALEEDLWFLYRLEELASKMPSGNGTFARSMVSSLCQPHHEMNLVCFPSQSSPTVPFQELHLKQEMHSSLSAGNSHNCVKQNLFFSWIVCQL